MLTNNHFQPELFYDSMYNKIMKPLKSMIKEEEESKA